MASEQQQGREHVQVEFNQVLPRQSEEHQAEDVTCDKHTHKKIQKSATKKASLCDSGCMIKGRLWLSARPVFPITKVM